MRWACLVVAAACSSPPPPPLDAVPAPVPPPAPAPGAAPAPPAPPPPPPLLHAAIPATDGAIFTMVALSEDGDAAATVDGLGAVRLWPALDGTREPVVVTAAPPVMVAIARAGTGFGVATVDTAGTLAIARLAGNGDQVVTAQLATELPVVALAAGARGFYAVLADDTIEQLDAAGARVATWRATPGERVEAVIARGGRALAVVSAGREIHGRWLDRDRFATPTPALAGVGASAALSPDGRYLAARVTPSRVAVFELASGRRVARLRCDQLLGYTDGDVIACARDGAVHWWNQLGAHLAVEHPGDDDRVDAGGEESSALRGFGAIAAAHHRVIRGYDAQLALVEPSAVRFLGYTVGFELGTLHDTPLGVVVGTHTSVVRDTGAVDTTPVLVLSDELRETRAIPGLPRPARAAADRRATRDRPVRRSRAAQRGARRSRERGQARAHRHRPARG